MQNREFNEYWTEELKKCQNSIEYFYENYVLIDGKKPVIFDKDKISLNNYGPFINTKRRYRI